MAGDPGLPTGYAGGAGSGVLGAALSTLRVNGLYGRRVWGEECPPGLMEKWWRRRESNPRPKWSTEASLRAYPAYESQRCGPDRRGLTASSLEDLGSRPQAAASTPACEDDASRRPAGPPPFSGRLEIRQRKQTADWQFWFSDRFTGARNPARLTSSIPSRRIRYAPFPRETGSP